MVNYCLHVNWQHSIKNKWSKKKAKSLLEEICHYLWLSSASTCIEEEKGIFCINPLHFTSHWVFRDHILQAITIYQKALSSVRTFAGSQWLNRNKIGPSMGSWVQESSINGFVSKFVSRTKKIIGQIVSFTVWLVKDVLHVHRALTI